MDTDRVFVPEAGDDQRYITVTKENGGGGVDHCADNIVDPNRTVSGRFGTIFLDDGWFPENYESTWTHVSAGYQCNEWGFDRRDPRWKMTDFWCYQSSFT